MQGLTTKAYRDALFYVVAREAGAEHPSLPVWTCDSQNPAGLALNASAPTVVRREVTGVPATFQLFNLLSSEECQRLIEVSEALGYREDAAVSLPRHIRHNDNVVWVTDQTTDGIIWQRAAAAMMENNALFGAKKPLGLNARFRFYRYGEGDFFAFHSDGGWPGSRVIDGRLVGNAYPDRFSLMTFLILLNDNFEGGATRFRVNADNPSAPAGRHDRLAEVDVHTPQGAALCFPHGTHPLHCIHSGATISAGTKYIIRTDVLFEL